MATKKSPYIEHPAAGRWKKVIASMADRTGKPLEAWVALTKKTGPATEKEQIAWLRKTHGLGMESATIVAWTLSGKPLEVEQKPAETLEELFKGPKAALKPLYEQILMRATRLGDDVTVTTGRTMVSIRRKVVFAQLKPSTNTRLDLGLALGDQEGTSKIIETGGLAKGDRITHRIPILSNSDITPDVAKWLKIAYDRS